MRYSLVVFFFQAEDGIRDDLVTGVQTCALPICRPLRSAKPPTSHVALGDVYRQMTSQSGRASSSMDVRFGSKCEERRPSGIPALSISQPRFDLAGLQARSEERRVGKECRSRWSP